MQATNTAARPVFSVRRSVRAWRSVKTPNSFEDALKRGWLVASENTAITVDGKNRRGRVILTKKGIAQRLSVPYTANKGGFQFGTPQLI